MGGLHGEGGWFNIQYQGVLLETRLDNHHRRLAQHSSLQKGRLGGAEDVKKGARPYFLGGGAEGGGGQGGAGLVRWRGRGERLCALRVLGLA